MVKEVKLLSLNLWKKNNPEKVKIAAIKRTIRWQKNNPERAKELAKKSTKKYRELHRSVCLKSSEKWQKNNPERAKNISRNYHWKKQGIKNLRNDWFKVEDYDNLYKIQEGKCAICIKHSSVFDIKLAVDHNHKTGKTRGLLCASCNSFLVAVERRGSDDFTNFTYYLTKHN